MKRYIHSRLKAREIVAIRQRLGLTRAQLADAVGVSFHTVKSWELGRRTCRGPSAAVLRELQP